ncbi:MAG: site-specific integrase [Ruminococcaceae bacterium]|nr:site-specific integrase [Oscillospiraceae bacterium]
MAKRRKNGKGVLRQRKDGRWEGRVVVGYDDKGLPKTKNVLAKTKTECAEKLEKLREEYRPPSTRCKPDMLFGDYIDFWYENFCKPAIRPLTQTNYENRIYDHIIPEIGKIPLNKLTQNDLQQFYARLKRNGRKQYVEKYGTGLSDRMVRACHASCRMALEKAVAEGLIRVNPAIGCKLPPKKAREMQVLTKDELQRFLAQAKEDGYYELFLLELGTGMRRGELMGLQWDDLNFRTGELHIVRQACAVNGKIEISMPKTNSSIRTVVLPPSLVEVLRKYKETINSRWMFPSPQNLDVPRYPTSVGDILSILLKRAGCKKVRFHDLRHTFATMAIANGMDVKTLSATIGHVSATTTLDIYSHRTVEMEVRAAENIERGIGKCEPSPIPPPEKPNEEPAKGLNEPFTPYKGKIRKSGSGCIYKINDHLYEGSFSPTHANGKRVKHNVYAETRDEVEVKLAELIERVREEIRLEKEEMMKGGHET